MPKHALTIAISLTASLVLALLGSAYWHRGLDLADAQRQAAEARGSAETNAAVASQLESALQVARQREEDLERQAAEVTRTQKTLEEQMRRALESKDITISELQGKLTVNILDRILFDSGEAQVKPEGQAVLQSIAGILAQFPNRQIHIIGHTDNVPIRSSSRGRYASNWELSTARATAAVRFLSEQAGVDPHRLGAVGYGEFHPLADNATPEGRARNRRIAVVVLSEELVGADAGPPPLPANAPALPPSLMPGESLPDTNAPVPAVETNAPPVPPSE